MWREMNSNRPYLENHDWMTPAEEEKARDEAYHRDRMARKQSSLDEKGKRKDRWSQYQITENSSIDRSGHYDIDEPTME